MKIVIILSVQMQKVFPNRCYILNYVSFQAKSKTQNIDLKLIIGKKNKQQKKPMSQLSGTDNLEGEA